jgi:predicted  nucleic acid-binding Zn ribbon protein
MGYIKKTTDMNYDRVKYKIWNWKSPVILHWIINSGLVINELILGQTIPKVMLIEREGKNSYFKPSMVPCPHCGTLHNGLKWSSQNKTAIKNWFGYYCDNCKKIIPVQKNLTS